MRNVNMSRLLIIVLICLLPSCNQSKQSESEDSLCNFADSVKIIRSLIETKTVYKIFEEPKQEEIDFLLNNFSPAEIAFESEVLRCTIPVLIYFYEKEVKQRDLLQELAQKYNDRIKILLLDVDQFPCISEVLELTTFPVVILMNQREEAGRFSEGGFGAIDSVVAQNLHAMSKSSSGNR